MDKLNIAMSVLITGITVVFFVLIILIFIIKVYGESINNFYKEKKKKSLIKLKNNKCKANKLYNSEETFKKENLQQEIKPEIIAVIAAAVASLEDDDKKYSIKNISKVVRKRPIWGTAGVIDNTRPF